MEKTSTGVVKERPNFGNKQVKKASELEMGIKYRKHHGSGTEIIIPIRKSYRNGWIKVKTIHDHESITDKDIEIAAIGDIFLGDCGVIPYENGMWNPRNWLEKLEKMTQCPECGSKNYFQPKDITDEGICPILECRDCGKRWWSD